MKWFYFDHEIFLFFEYIRIQPNDYNLMINCSSLLTRLESVYGYDEVQKLDSIIAIYIDFFMIGLSFKILPKINSNLNYIDHFKPLLYQICKT